MCRDVFAFSESILTGQECIELSIRVLKKELQSYLELSRVFMQLQGKQISSS